MATRLWPAKAAAVILTEMGLAALLPSAMAAMLVRFVDHLQKSGGKGRGELFLNGVFDGHGMFFL